MINHREINWYCVHKIIKYQLKVNKSVFYRLATLI